MKNCTIRWHSRAGQGAITASEAIAKILAEKFHTQSFSKFGAEKRGAPVEVFTRISTEKIEKNFPPKNPDFIILFDATLINPAELSPEEICRGTTRDSTLISNSVAEKSPINFPGKVFHCGADAIARENIGREIPNVPIVGAFLAISKIFPTEKFAEKLEKILTKNFPQKIVAGNLTAFFAGGNQFFPVKK